VRLGFPAPTAESAPTGAPSKFQPMDIEPVDPGWRPAARSAAALLVGRRPATSILEVMRGSIVLLSAAAGTAALIALVLGAGSGEPRIDRVAAQVLLGAGVIAAATVMATVGRILPEVDPSRLAVFLFVATQRKVLAAAAVGPLGLILSWLAADGALVIFGMGTSILLMAVAAPTADRIRIWQEEVDTFEHPYSVLGALLRSYET
jgi:hypothetical protein